MCTKETENLLEGFTFVGATNNFGDSFIGGDKNIHINMSLEEVDSNTHGWLWAVQVEEISADVVKIAR